jgi:hypothetical protein
MLPIYEYRTVGTAIRSVLSNKELQMSLNGDELCVKVSTEYGRVTAAVKELIALTVYGPAPHSKCRYCGAAIRYKTVQVNGRIMDASPQNLKYEPDRKAEREHKNDCLDCLLREPSRTRADAGEHPNASPSPWNYPVEWHWQEYNYRPLSQGKGSARPGEHISAEKTVFSIFG